MLTKIQTFNSFASGRNQKSETPVSLNPYFSAKIVTKADKFEKQSFVPNSNFKLAFTGAQKLDLEDVKRGLTEIIRLSGKQVPDNIEDMLLKVRESSLCDGLTGLYKNEVLHTTVKEEFEAAKTLHDKKYSVIMFDLDFFKQFNDRFDYKTGDEALKSVASNINQIAEKYGGKAFRYHGEEFVVTLLNKDKNIAKVMAEEIAESVKQDKILKSLVFNLLKNANNDLDFISQQLPQLQLIFEKLRGAASFHDYRSLGDDISSLINSYIKRYNPKNVSVLKEITTKIKTSDETELQEFLRIDTKLSNESTLAVELDKIVSRYKQKYEDIAEAPWYKHYSDKKTVTLSGGSISLEDIPEAEDGEFLIDVSNYILKSAKDNGRDRICVAEKNTIEKAMEEMNKNKNLDKCEHPVATT